MTEPTIEHQHNQVVEPTAVEPAVPTQEAVHNESKIAEHATQLAAQQVHNEARMAEQATRRAERQAYWASLTPVELSRIKSAYESAYASGAIMTAGNITGGVAGTGAITPSTPSITYNTSIDYSTMSPASLALLTPDQIKFIPPDQLFKMSVAQLASVTMETGLSPEQQVNLTEYQKSAIITNAPIPETVAGDALSSADALRAYYENNLKSISEPTPTPTPSAVLSSADALRAYYENNLKSISAPAPIPTPTLTFTNAEGLTKDQIDTLNAMVSQGKSQLELSNYLNAQGIPQTSSAYGIAHTAKTTQPGDYVVSKEIQSGAYSVVKPDGTVEVYSKDSGIQTYKPDGSGSYVLVQKPIIVTPDMVYKFTIPENSTKVYDNAKNLIGYKDENGVTWWTPESVSFRAGYMNDQTRGATPITQGINLTLADGTQVIVSKAILGQASQLQGENQFKAYQDIGIYGQGDIAVYKDGTLAGVIPEITKYDENGKMLQLGWDKIAQEYKDIFNTEGYQAMANAIQKDALAIDAINKYGSIDNYIRESIKAGVSQDEISATLMSAINVTKDTALSVIDIGKYDNVESYIISSINNGMSVDAIKGTLSSAGYINVNDAVDSMAVLMASLPTMSEDLRNGFNGGGVDGYKNVLLTNYTVLPDGQYISNTQLEKLKTDSPDYLYKIATTQGMGNLLNQYEFDSKLQTDALSVLENKGYIIQPQDNTALNKIYEGIFGVSPKILPEAPYVPQYDIKRFVEENPNQDSIQVLSNAYGSNSEVVKDAQNYVDYLNSIVSYLDKNVDDSTIPAAYDLALGRAIDRAGYSVKEKSESSFGLNLGAEQTEPARYTWRDLTDEQKKGVVKYYIEDPYRDNLLSSLVAEYDYAYAKLPTAAKIALPIGVAAIGFIAAPLAIAGMALFTTDAIVHTVAPLTISNKTLNYQIDQNAKYFGSVQSVEGMNSVVLDYLSQSINSVTGEKVLDPIKAYNALSPEDKAKVDAEYTRKQLGLDPSAMQYVMAGGMVVASAIPLIGGAIKGITGTAGAVARGALVGTQVGLTGMFIGTSVPTILNKNVEISDKITAIAFDVMMLHGLGKMAGIDKALSSTGGIAKSLITGKGLPARALSVSKGEIYRARVPEEFISQIDRIQNKIEGIRDVIYSDKLSVDQKINAVKEVLSPEDFATVKKLIDYVDNIQKQKTTEADYDNFDFTVVKNASEKIGTANNELKSYFTENGLGVYGSTVEYLFKGAVKGMKPGDFDVRVFLDSGLKDRAKIASDLAEILRKNGVDAQASGSSVKVNGEKIFDIHNWNEKFNTTSLMPFGWEQKGYVVKDGVRLVPIEEQAASRVKSIFDKAAVEGTIGTKPGELGVLLPEQLKVSEAQRTYDNAKIAMRLTELLEKSEAYFKDKGDLSKATDIKEIVDILSKPTTTKPILSAEEQIRIQENEFGTVENYRAEVAKAQVEALKYWAEGNKGAYTHKTELGEITINPTPINEVMPNTLFSVTGEGTSFTKGLEFDGKVVSGKVIENKGAELTVPTDKPLKSNVNDKLDGTGINIEQDISGWKIELDSSGKPIINDYGLVKIAKGGNELFISGKDAEVLARTIANGIDAGKWIEYKYEAADKQIPIFTSDELAYKYLEAKYGGKENIPPDAMVIAVRIDAKNDIRGAKPTDVVENVLESGGLIDPVQKIQYDFTTDGAKPVVENELTVKVGGELLKTPKTELSDKYGIDTGVTETKDINTGKTYKVLWLATENAIKAGYGYTPTASQVRTASFLALKGMISDILHPHKPSDIIFTDETVATRGTLFDLFHVDKIKFKADDGAFKSPKEIRDAVIQEDKTWLEKAGQIIKDKIKLLHEDEAGFVKLYGKEEAVKLKEVIESTKSSDYVDYVRNEKDKLQVKEIEDKINQNKEVKDYLDKVSAETKANLLTVNLTELTRPFFINTGNALADIQESSNLYNLDTIGAYGEKNTSPLSVAPMVSEDKVGKSKTGVKPETKLSDITPIEKEIELDISKPIEITDVKPTELLEFSSIELPEFPSIESIEITPIEDIEPVEPNDITPVETTPIETIEPVETTPIEPTETIPIEPTEVTPIEPTDITPIETTEVTEIEKTEPPPPPTEPPPPPVPPPPEVPPPPIYSEIPDEAKDEEGKLKPGTITWRQGAPQGFPQGLWKVIPPPYRKEDMFTLKYPPPGTHKFATGKGSAYKTIQSLGKPPKDADVELGWANVHISSETGIMDIEYRPNEKANTGTREETIGMGEGQIPYEGVERDLAESKLTKEQEEFLVENPELDVEDIVPLEYPDNQLQPEPTEEPPEEIPADIVKPRKNNLKSDNPVGLQKTELPQYRAGKTKFYLVNGEFARNVLSEGNPEIKDFNTDGSWLDYVSIPKNEVWIDRTKDSVERKTAILDNLKKLRFMDEDSGMEEILGTNNQLELDKKINDEIAYYNEPVSAKPARTRYPTERPLKPRKSVVKSLEEEYAQYDVPPTKPRVASSGIVPQYYLGRLIEPKIKVTEI